LSPSVSLVLIQPPQKKIEKGPSSFHSSIGTRQLAPHRRILSTWDLYLLPCIWWRTWQFLPGDDSLPLTPPSFARFSSMNLYTLKLLSFILLFFLFDCFQISFVWFSVNGSQELGIIEKYKLYFRILFITWIIELR